MSDERIDDLKSADPGIRSAALEDLLGDIDDKLAEEMMKIAEGSFPDEVRGDAMIGLGPIMEECGEDYEDGGTSSYGEEFGTPLSKEKFEDLRKRLRTIFEDESQPQFVRRRAIESLVRDPQAWQNDAISKLFATGEVNWMRTSLFAMGFVDGFEKEIISALQHANQEIVYEAVRAAGRQEVTAAAGTITGFATSAETDHDVRVESIIALPYVDHEAREILEELAESDDAEISEAAEAAMEELDMIESGEYELDDEDDVLK